MTQQIINDVLPLTQAIAIVGQTIFSTNWTANVGSDVIVFYTPNGDQPDDLTQQLATNEYTVQFIGGSRIVQVTLVNPANAGDMISITRMTPASFLNLYTNTNFVPSMLNNDFGILTLVDQQAQLVNTQVAPRYNFSAFLNENAAGADIYLPILGANQVWMKNNNNTSIVAVDLSTFSGGTVTSITAGDGLDGGEITTVGTISLGEIADQTILGNISGSTAVPVGVPISTLLGAYLPLAGGTMSGPIDMGTHNIIDMADPINAQDAATKAYVDSMVGGSGTVTSITAGVGLTGGTITTSGTIALASTLPANLTIPEPMIDKILDANGNVVLGLTSTASAVNFVSAVNQISGQPPGFNSSGSDTNVGMGFNSKGTGIIQFSSANTTIPWIISSGTALHHNTQFAFANTAATRTVTFQDSDGTLAYLSNITGVYLPLAGGTMTGTLNLGMQTLTGIPNPVNPTDAVNLQTLNLGLQSLNPVESVEASSTANLTATYNNGTSGVGATLTNSGTQAALVLDGYTVQVNDRILIANQTSSFQNGIYVATNVGSVSTNWVLTRASDNNSSSNMLKGNFVAVQNGTTFKGTSTAQSSTVTTVGTDAVTYTIIFSPQTYTGATSITTLGTITTGTWNGSNIPLANGGTNASLTAANGAIPYSTASAIAFLAPTSTALQPMLSGANSSPSWASYSLPSSAGASGNLLTSNGTNLVSSPPATTIKQAIVTLNQSQIQGMSATPIQIIPAQGAGVGIQIVSATISIIFNTSAMTNGGVTVLQYGSTALGAGTSATNGTFGAIASNPSNGFFQKAGVNSAIITGMANVGVFLSNQTGAFLGGGSGTQLIVNVLYYNIST